MAHNQDDLNFWLYNAKDSVVLLDALPALRSQLERQGNVRAYEQQRDLIEPLIYMQERGMLIDRDGLKKQNDDSTELVNKYMKELRDCVGSTISVKISKELDEYLVVGKDGADRMPKKEYNKLNRTDKPFNIGSNQQLCDFFYVKKGFKPYFKEGKPTTEGLALKRLSRKGCTEAQHVMAIRQLLKLKSTYYEMKISEDGRLRSAMNPVGTNEMRLSSSEDIFGCGGNIQNLPGSFKKFIIADPGYIMYDIDLSGADNRVVAYIAPEPRMIKAFEAGIDMHKLTYSMMFGVPYEEVSDEPGSSPLGLGLYSQRFWAKKANHSFNYGLSGKGFAIRFEMPNAEGDLLRARYLSAYPGVPQYWAWTQAKLSKDRTLENPFGVRRKFMGRWGDDLFRQAYAWIPASTVANTMNFRGVLEIYYNQVLYKHVELLNIVHDSVVIQIPISTGFEYHANTLIKIVSNLSMPIQWKQTPFIIPADVKMGLNLKDMTKVKGLDSSTIEGIYSQIILANTTTLESDLGGDEDDDDLESRGVLLE